MQKRYTLYRFWDRSGRLLYVGVTGDPETRWRTHGGRKTWWREVCRVTVEHFGDRLSLESAEIAAIDAEAPKYNVIHNRGRGYVRKVRAARVVHTCAAGKESPPGGRTLTLMWQEPCEAGRVQVQIPAAVAEMNQGKPWLRPGAEMLRRLHDESGITGKALATALGCVESKITRVRSAVVSPADEFAVAWARACRADDQQIAGLLEVLEQVPQLRCDLTERQPMATPAVAHHDKLTAESTHLRYFDLSFVTGLLQTREYALHAFSEIWEVTRRTDDVHDAVVSRMRRQAHLHDLSKTFQCLVWEPVLLQRRVPTEIMIPQLYVLLTWLTAPNVQFGILPLRADAGRTPLIGFQMYDDMAIAEDLLEEWPRPGDKYDQIFENMWGNAAVGADARPFIERAIAEVDAKKA